MIEQLGALLSSFMINLVVSVAILWVFMLRPIRTYQRAGAAAAVLVTFFITLEATHGSVSALPWISWGAVASYVLWRSWTVAKIEMKRAAEQEERSRAIALDRLDEIAHFHRIR